MATYRIVRMYSNRRGTDIIVTGLTLAEAKRHCSDPETSSLTSTCPKVKANAKRWGNWFDGYEKENA